MVREFAREDERRVMLVLDPFIGPPPMPGQSELRRDSRPPNMPSVSSAPFPWPPASPGTSTKSIRRCNFAPIVSRRPWRPSTNHYDALRELAPIQPDISALGGDFLDDLASEREIFKIILTARPQNTIPTALWSSSYFLFLNSL